MDWLPQLYPLSGIVIGIIIGLTGVGGGSLMTPLLIFAFGVAPVTAVGTALLYGAITKAGGLYMHDRDGMVDYRIAGLLCRGSLPAALITGIALFWLVKRPATLSTLTNASLAVALLLTAAALVWQARRTTAAPAQTRSPRSTDIATILVGALLGIMVTLSSVGAGVLAVAALTLLYPHRPPAQMAGTAIAHAVALTLFAGLAHSGLGTVDLTRLASLLIGSLPGVMVGTYLARKLPNRLLLPALTATLVLAGIGLGART